jgi:hypothetical protein
MLTYSSEKNEKRTKLKEDRNTEKRTLIVSRHFARQPTFWGVAPLGDGTPPLPRRRSCSMDDVTSGTASRFEERRRGHLLTSASGGIPGEGMAEGSDPAS